MFDVLAASLAGGPPCFIPSLIDYDRVASSIPLLQSRRLEDALKVKNQFRPARENHRSDRPVCQPQLLVDETFARYLVSSAPSKCNHLPANSRANRLRNSIV
jgi:hypothetical protein